MNTLAWQEIERGLSPERLGPYLRHTNSPTDAIRIYVWNMALCESLYPLFHLAEVTLRNRFHGALTRRFQRPDWYDMPWLSLGDSERVRTAKGKLRDPKRPVTPGRVVAELTFGFWISLLDRRYEHKQVLWPHLAPLVFGSAPRSLRTARLQSPYASRVRDLRNRVFHHEPIWHFGDLAKRVHEAEQWLGWLNPEIARLHQLVQRFQTLHGATHTGMPAIDIR